MLLYMTEVWWTDV